MSKQCEDGKILNPATGRCVSANGAIGKSILLAKAKTLCPKGKILNPATLRCVNIDGKLGLSIQAALKTKSPLPKPKASKPSSPKPKASKSSSSKPRASKSSSPKQQPQPQQDEFKMAKVWVRAPWRDLNNVALNHLSDDWKELYNRFAQYFERIFTIKGSSYALDAYSNRGDDKVESKLKLIHANMGSFNRMDLALLIANCIISYFSYYDGSRKSKKEIYDMCFKLLEQYYKAPKIPYTRTLSWKCKYPLGEDYTFIDQLSRNWQGNLPKNVEKYPYNELLPKVV